jgi:hypothetical protein
LLRRPDRADILKTVKVGRDLKKEPSIVMIQAGRGPENLWFVEALGGDGIGSEEAKRNVHSFSRKSPKISRESPSQRNNSKPLNSYQYSDRGYLSDKTQNYLPGDGPPVQEAFWFPEGEYRSHELEQGPIHVGHHPQADVGVFIRQTMEGFRNQGYLSDVDFEIASRSLIILWNEATSGVKVTK